MDWIGDDYISLYSTKTKLEELHRIVYRDIRDVNIIAQDSKRLLLTSLSYQF